MADQNPTAGPRVVPLDLPPAQTEILHAELLGWIDEDLESPDLLPDPGAMTREAEAFRRLLVAVDTCEIVLPDEEARAALAKAAEGHDETVGYERTVAVHDAHHALLGVLSATDREGAGR
jgi:hypothetical protein